VINKKKDTERILIVAKQYRENSSEKIQCLCGGLVVKYKYSDNCQTKKQKEALLHKDFITS
jgi:hypothetical protein